MFDRLIISSGRAARPRSSASFGVALLTHASVVVAILLIPLLFPEIVNPDPGDVLAFVGSPTVLPPPLPPRRGGGGSPPEKVAQPERPPVALKPGATYAPREISDHIPPPDEPFLPADLLYPNTGDGTGVVSEGIGPGGDIGVLTDAPPLWTGGRPDIAPPPPPDEPAPAAPVQVAARVLSARLISKIEPEYPLAARLARKDGVVILQVLIDETGRVSEVTVVSGNVLFRQEAVTAVRQWVYTPLLINGIPRPVLGTVVLRFILR
jgi:protein TonB